MSKKRVHEIAKEFGVESKQVISILQQHNINVTKAVNSVDDSGYEIVKKQLGKKYVWAKSGPSSFDCSGFTSYVFRNAAGVSLPRTTYEQINVGTPVAYSDLQPGDLVFPHTGHVGIYVGNGQMIHAPSTGDVIKVSSVYKFYTARRVS